MSDLLSPSNSPNGSSPRAGAGVKRLNKVPLMFATGIGALVLGVIVFTYHQRVEATEMKQQTAAASVASPITGSAEILSDAPNAGLIAPSPQPAGLTENGPAGPIETADTGNSASPDYQSVSPTPADRSNSDAWQEYEQEKQAVDQARFSALQSAYGAVPTVKLADSTAPAGLGGIASLAMPGGPQGGLSPTQALSMAQAAQAAAQAASASASNIGSTGLSGLLNSTSASTPPSDSDANDQSGKEGFLDQAGSNTDADYLTARESAPVSRYEVKAGSVIPAAMIGGINSDLPGQVTAEVRETVYDTATGQIPLIPQGSKLVGIYSSAVTYGQTRVLVAWNRIIFPNGNSFDLGTMPGADASGYAGFSDEVNNHYLRIFSSAILASALSAGAQLSQPQNSDGTVSSSQIMAASLGQEVNTVGSQIIQKGLNIQPTLIIRNGYLFNVSVTKDMVLTPWTGEHAVPYGTPGRQ